MKGLIIKDFYILKKEYLLILAFSVVTLIVLVLGNKVNTDYHFNFLIESVSAIALPLAALSCATVVSSYKIDNKCEHEQYLMITPTSRKTMVGSKIIMLTVISVISSVLLFFMALSCCFIFKISFTEKELSRTILVLLLQSIFSFFLGAVNIYSHEKHGEDKRLVYALPPSLLEYFAYANIVTTLSDNKNMNSLFYFMITLSLIYTVYCIIRSFMLTEKKEV